MKTQDKRLVELVAMITEADNLLAQVQQVADAAADGFGQCSFVLGHTKGPHNMVSDGEEKRHAFESLVDHLTGQTNYGDWMNKPKPTPRNAVVQSVCSDTTLLLLLGVIQGTVQRERDEAIRKLKTLTAQL